MDFKGVSERLSSQGTTEGQFSRVLERKEHSSIAEYAEDGEYQARQAVDSMTDIEERVFAEGVPEAMSTEQIDAFLALFEPESPGSYADDPPGAELEKAVSYLIETDNGAYELGAMLVEQHRDDKNPPKTPATLLFGRELVTEMCSLRLGQFDVDKPLAQQFRREALPGLYRDMIRQSVAKALEDNQLSVLSANDLVLDQAIPRLYGHMDEVNELDPQEQFLVALYHQDLVGRLFNKQAEEQSKDSADRR
jgi:hypothetical protein